jgi:GTP-binding protein Era
MLKRIGTAARRDLERFFGIKVYLELRVQVRANWRKDAKALREFGFMQTS